MKKIIAGNWKMNMTPAQTTAFIKEFSGLTAGLNGCDIVLCVPAIDIPAAASAAKGTNIKIGGQNIHFKESGAYTGEISGAMLTEAGAEYVIVGHSERRQYFGETDETVNLRAKAALAAGLKVIICVGEMREARESGITEELVAMQTKLTLAGITADEMANVIIAYEPVWAIGTGLTATDEQADEACGVIRGVVAKLYGADIAAKLPIQYGGSMNEKNAASLLSRKNVDGGLIGGASLKPPALLEIVKAAQ
jgi:triosephosphate isomerase